MQSTIRRGYATWGLAPAIAVVSGTQRHLIAHALQWLMISKTVHFVNNNSIAVDSLFHLVTLQKCFALNKRWCIWLALPCKIKKSFWITQEFEGRNDFFKQILRNDIQFPFPVFLIIYYYVLATYEIILTLIKSKAFLQSN